MMSEIEKKNEVHKLTGGQNPASGVGGAVPPPGAGCKKGIE